MASARRTTEFLDPLANCEHIRASSRCAASRASPRSCLRKRGLGDRGEARANECACTRIGGGRAQALYSLLTQNPGAPPRVKIRVEKNGFEASDNAAAPKREEKSLRWHSKKVVLDLGMNGGAGQPGAHQLHSPLCVQRAASWAANQALWNGPRTHSEQLRGSRGGIIARRRWKSTRAFLTV